MVFLILGGLVGLIFGIYRMYMLNRLKAALIEVNEITKQRNYYQNQMNIILKEKQALFNDYIIISSKLKILQVVK